MSELMNARATTMGYRRRFLSTASIAALLSLAMASGEAQAGDTGQPIIWIDLGWHFERVGGQGDAYAPPFLQISPRPDFETVSPLALEKRLPYAYSAEGALSYRPEDTNWVFTGAVRFGRAQSHKVVHQQTDAQYPDPLYTKKHNAYPSQTFPRSIDRPNHQFADTDARNSETHAVVDFRAGKDVGLGMFGSDGSSIFGAGIRFAQFSSKSEAKIRENPDLYWPMKDPNKYPSHHHAYYASLHSTRSFHGIGPSVSWNASAAIAGNEQDGELRIDWGLNAALLFGRQKVKAHHATKGAYYYRPKANKYFNTQITPYTNNPPDGARSRSVTVPNVGGFAGLSYRVQNFQMSLGYRADYFIGAVDGGWDTRHDVTHSFNGPFASVSFGVSPSAFLKGEDMNELMTARNGIKDRLWLATTSAIALTLALAGQVHAGDEPALWIGFGWHAEDVYGSVPGFALPLSDLVPQQGFTAPLLSGSALSRSIGNEGEISFRPGGGVWLLSLSVRYGRSHGTGKPIDQTTAIPTTHVDYHTSIPAVSRYSDIVHPVIQHTRHVDAETVNTENHYIIDFRAGRDVGMGLFGKNSSSVVGVGVRYAQLHSALNVTQFHATPDAKIEQFQSTAPISYYISGVLQSVPKHIQGYHQVFHVLAGNPHSGHDFNGLGPAIYWDASAALLGNPDTSGQLSFDWGVNAALLFGRQKTKIEHQTHGLSRCYGYHCGPQNSFRYDGQYANTAQTVRTKNVKVPNLGGFASLTYRIEDIKFSVGYRGDYFIDAVDTGFTGQDAMTRAFYGPFASVSVGIGG